MAFLLRGGRMVGKLPANYAVKIGSNAISSNWKIQSACLSSGRGGKKVDPNVLVPDDFFDKVVENDKQFLDYLTTIVAGKGSKGLEVLTTLQDPLTWDKLDEELGGNDAPNKSNYSTSSVQAGKSVEEISANYDYVERDDTTDDLLEENDDVYEHLRELTGVDGVSGPFTMPEQLNFSIPWKTQEDVDTNELAKFIPESSGELFAYDNQGSRSCDGHRQRAGRDGILRCHKIDLQLVSHLNLNDLTRFTSEDNEIMGRRDSGLCAKCQRKVARTIKRARNYGLLSHLGQSVLINMRPAHHDKILHDNANPKNVHMSGSQGLVQTKTID